MFSTGLHPYRQQHLIELICDFFNGFFSVKYRLLYELFLAAYVILRWRRLLLCILAVKVDIVSLHIVLHNLQVDSLAHVHHCRDAGENGTFHGDLLLFQNEHRLVKNKINR